MAEDIKYFYTSVELKYTDVSLSDEELKDTYNESLDAFDSTLEELSRVYHECKKRKFEFKCLEQCIAISSQFANHTLTMTRVIDMIEINKVTMMQN